MKYTIASRDRFDKVLVFTLICGFASVLGFALLIYNQPISAHFLDPIAIDGNAELDAFCAGNGTTGEYGDPYIIRDLEFGDCGIYWGLSILHTTRYLIILNCTFENKAISLHDSNNIDIINCSLTDARYGFYTYNCVNLTMQNLNISVAATDLEGPQIQILISHNVSLNDILIENTISTFWGIHLNGPSTNFSLANISCINSADEIDYSGGINCVEIDNLTVIDAHIFKQYRGFAFINCNNLSILNNSAEYTETSAMSGQSSPAFDFRLCQNVTFENNYAARNRESVRIIECGNMTLQNNILDANGIYSYPHNGFDLSDSGDISIDSNQITWADIGIHAQRTQFTNISQNNITRGYDGIYFWKVNNCSITFNNCSDFSNTAFYQSETENNTILQNNFTNAWVGIRSDSSRWNLYSGNYILRIMGNYILKFDNLDEYFDNGTHGNYWGDYESRYPSALNDGYIWDTPYMIPMSNWDGDYFPLVYNLAPVISTPDDIAYPFGNPGHLITWEINDRTNLTTSYEITRDSLPILSGSWIPGQLVSCPADGLALGTHIFEIIALDGFGGESRDQVEVIVTNNIPVTSHPIDLNLYLGGTGAEIRWAVADDSVLNPTFSIYEDGAQVRLGSWISGQYIAHNVDSLPEGRHNITLSIQDGLGLSASDVVFVNVLNTVPTIIRPADFTGFAGNNTYNSTWIIFDDVVGITSYRIYVNNTYLTRGTWRSGIPIVLTFTNWSVGVYNVSLVAEDGYGQVIRDSLIITIVPEEGGIDLWFWGMIGLIIAGCAAGGILIYIYVVKPRLA